MASIDMFSAIIFKMFCAGYYKIETLHVKLTNHFHEVPVFFHQTFPCTLSLMEMQVRILSWQTMSPPIITIIKHCRIINIKPKNMTLEYNINTNI